MSERASAYTNGSDERGGGGAITPMSRSLAGQNIIRTHRQHCDEQQQQQQQLGVLTCTRPTAPHAQTAAALLIPLLARTYPRIANYDNITQNCGESGIGLFAKYGRLVRA